MNGYCNYECGNKTPYGTCALTACTNPKYNGFNKTDLTSNLYQVNVPQTAPTHKSVLLERWAKDTREMATKTIRSLYSAKMDRYEIPTSAAMYLTRDTEDAIEHYIAYLNAAPEAGK